MSYGALLKTFWEAHDPTQGMRQGNDVGTQYRSAIKTTTRAQEEAAEKSSDTYAKALSDDGICNSVTEIDEAPPFYYAEGLSPAKSRQESGRLLRPCRHRVSYPIPARATAASS